MPPVCTPESIVRTLKEIEEIDVCIDKEVICTDPTGGDLTLESQSGTALDEGLLVIKIHEDPWKLGLSACISSSLKDKFKTYEVRIQRKQQLLHFTLIGKCYIYTLNVLVFRLNNYKLTRYVSLK